MNRKEKLQGIVLRRYDFGEADKIVTVFTRERGKIRLLAKGVRRIMSRRAPHLEIFNYVELYIYHGKNFDSISEAKTIEDFSEIKKDLDLCGYGFYLMEVVDKLLPEEVPHEEIFDKLYKSLKNLNGEKTVKEFVVELLWELGFLPRGEFPKQGVTSFVEEIAERKIKSKKFLEEIYG